MKKILVACLIISQGAQAQVMKCPKFYPGQASDRARLVSAGVTMDEPTGGGDLHGDIRKIKGGRVVEYAIPSGARWFICTYGDRYNLHFPQQLSDKVAQCKLMVKDKDASGMMDATLTCK
jgi:hypothetical protein